MLATCFAAYSEQSDVCVFASGVSNSKTHDTRAFKREEALLTETLTTHPNAHLLYFSTCSVYDPAERDSAYCHHKLHIESLIQAASNHFTIFRVSQILGRSSNPNTLINFLLQAIIARQHFELWEYAYRNIIGLDDVAHIVDYVLQHQLFQNEIVNLACPHNLSVREIVHAVEQHTGLQAQYSLVPKGAGNYTIDLTAIQPVFYSLGLTFSETYLVSLLHSVYSDVEQIKKSL